MDREKLKRVLIRQVSDTRVCPKCRYHFVPEDCTAQRALDAYRELDTNSERTEDITKKTGLINLDMKTRIEIFTAKCQCRIWKKLETGNTNTDWEGEIEGIGDVVISMPAAENIHINRFIDLDKVKLTDGLFSSSSLPTMNAYVDHVTRLVVLLLNKELRVECPRKFAGKVICEDIDTLEFSFIYGFGN
jgi:hypothetical protein